MTLALYTGNTGLVEVCIGGREFSCWNAALKDALPRMMAVLQQEY